MPLKELEAIKNVFESLDIEVDLSEVAPELPLKQISVFISENPHIQVVIYFLSDLLALAPEGRDAAKQMQEQSSDLLQLFIRLPIEVKEETTADLARLLHMINWSTPIGTFGVNESQKLLYYRYVIECMAGGPQPELVADAVNGMAIYTEQRFELLESIASGDQSLKALVESLKEDGSLGEVFPGYEI